MGMVLWHRWNQKQRWNLGWVPNQKLRVIGAARWLWQYGWRMPDRIVDRRCVIRGTTTHLWFLRHLRNRLYRKPIYIFAWLKSVCRHKVAICHHMNKQSVDILMIRVGWALGMRVIVVNAGDSQMGVPIIINYIAVVSLSPCLPTLSICTGRGNCMFSNIIERCLRASRYETNMNEQ